MNPFFAISEARRVPILAIALIAGVAALLIIGRVNTRASQASGGKINRPVDLLTTQPGTEPPDSAARSWIAVSLAVDFVFLGSLALVSGLASVWAAVYRLPWLTPLSTPIAWLVCVAALIDVGENLSLLSIAALWAHPSHIPAAATCFAFFCSRAKFVAAVGLSYALLVGVARLRTVL
jgi:hypothetical protein